MQLMSRPSRLYILLTLVFFAFGGDLAKANTPSVCYGTHANGSLTDGWRLPESGANFKTYSALGWRLQRTYVHSDVHALLLDAFARLELSAPQQHFVIGETGFAFGGPFAPHRTHQNGLSVDLMVPVKTSHGDSTTLPTHSKNKFGYGVDFDKRGHNKTHDIDFEMMALELAEISAASDAAGLKIRLIVFAPDLQARLRKTTRWKKIKHLTFSRRAVWVRHDDHFHIDFERACLKKMP